MINELNKYRVDIFKIAGFAVMVPFGRLFIEPTVIFNEVGLIGFPIYVMISFGLFMLGLMFICKGYDIIEEYDRE